MASDLNLDAIEQRANAATLGPWEQAWHAQRKPICLITNGNKFGIYGNAPCEYQHDDDANGDFIAHARTDIPALIARVRVLEAIIEATAREHECVAINADVWVHTRTPNAEGKPWIIRRNNAALVGYADTLWDAIAKGLADAEQT